MTTLLLPAFVGAPDVNKIYNMDAMGLLRAMPDNSVNCVVTSPPYWGLRDYNVDGQIGLEPTLKEFIDTLVILFREVRRVLRPDGTCWINMGDSYASSVNGRSAADVKAIGNDDRTFRDKPFSTVGNGLKPKDLCGQPWRLAFALQDDGWWLRQDIIWAKPNPMPESIGDRCTKSHEYVFLLTKSERYWFDADAIREPAQDWGERDRTNGKYHNPGTGLEPHSGLSGKVRLSGGNFSKQYAEAQPNHGGESERKPYVSRNKRSVWTVNTEPNSFAHFATFPTKLIEPMILAGCPDKVCSKCGAAWVREVEVSGGTIGKGWTDHTSDLEAGMSQVRHGGGVGAAKSDNGQAYTRQTLGFKPTCACNADTVPGVVYDPFMGSGTTALVARRLGRNYIGSELNAEYVAIARERLRMPFEEKHVKQDTRIDDLPLFAGIA